MTIENEQQYSLTLQWIERFKLDILTAETTGCPENLHPTLHQAAIDGMKSQLSDLQKQADDYERANK